MADCLIVEDSQAVRQILSRLIEAAGENVTAEAGDAAEGLEALAGANPDIVFLDWDLPQLDALEFLKGAFEMRLEKRPHIVLCAMENDAQQFALARAAGARFHVIKPYDRRDIADIFGVIGKAELMDADAADPLAQTA